MKKLLLVSLLLPTLAFGSGAYVSGGGSGSTFSNLSIDGNYAADTTGAVVNIGDAPPANTHTYPIHINISQSTAVQNWTLNPTTTLNAYTGWWAGINKSSAFIGLTYLPAAYNAAYAPVTGSTYTGDLGYIYTGGAAIALMTTSTSPVILGYNNTARWQMTGHFTPTSDNGADLGQPSLRVRNVYSGNNLTIGVQRVASASSGGSSAFDSNHAVMALHASGTLTSYTVTMPQYAYDGQIQTVTCNNAITSLTVNGYSTDTVIGGSGISVPLGTAARWIYVATDTAWYPN